MKTGRLVWGRDTAHESVYDVRKSGHRVHSMAPYDIATFLVVREQDSRSTTDPATCNGNDIRHKQPLTTAWQALSPRQHEAVELCLIEGMPQREAADLMGCTKQNVQRLLQKARRKLRDVDPPFTTCAVSGDRGSGPTLLASPQENPR